MNADITLTGNALKVLTGIIPAIQAIFGLGFIPKPDEVIEFSEEMYAAYALQSGNNQRPLYTVFSENRPMSPEINVVTEENYGHLMQGIAYFEQYAKKHGLTGDGDEILKHAANTLPAEITAKTPFERPNAIPTTKEHWMDFLAEMMDDDERITVKFKDERGVTQEHVIAPSIEKKLQGTERMTYEEFKKYTLDSLTKIFGQVNYEVVENISHKTDDLAYEVIHVKKKVNGTTSYNGFQVDPFYNEYMLGKPLGEIVWDMVQCVEDAHEWMKDIDLKKLSDFDAIKDSIIFRPLNYERNKNLLENYLYRRVGDIALVIYAIIMMNDDGLNTSKVDKKNIEEWNLSEEYIFHWAMKNTAKLFKPCIVPLDFIMSGGDMDHLPDKEKFFMEPGFRLKLSRIGAYNLFAESSRNAAGVVFYPGVLQRVAQLLRDDLHIVIADFSHAVIHAKRSLPLSRIKEICKKERNNPFADPDEFLSDKVYIYSRREGTLTIAE